MSKHYTNVLCQGNYILYRGVNNGKKVKGKVRCNIYTKTGSHIDSFDLKDGEMAIQLYGVHEYEILEEALVIENKNGPYFGPEKDRKRIDVKKN